MIAWIFWKTWYKDSKEQCFGNKYRFKITTQPKTDDLDYMMDPTFRNFNRLFVLLFKIDNNDPTRLYFDNHYMPLVEIKDFNWNCINWQ